MQSINFFLRSTLFFTMLYLLSCGSNSVPAPINTVNALLEMAQRMKDLYDSFTQSNDDMVTKVKEITSLTTQSINQKDDFADVARFWERHWAKIHERHQTLVAALQQLNIESSAYFAELAITNSKINDPNLKAEDAKKNQAFVRTWNIEYEKAYASLMNAQKMLQEGDDFNYILRNMVTRQEGYSTIPKLVSITNQAQMLSNSIKSFENNTKIIFQFSN